jgi:hypothetical protein
MDPSVQRAVAAMMFAPMLSGCVTTFDFTPAPAPQMRAAIQEVNEGRRASVRDDNGVVHEVTRETGVAYGKTPDDLAQMEKLGWLPGTVASDCARSEQACPLRDPSLSWAVGEPHSHVVWDFIVLDLALPAVLVGGFVAGNIVCVGEDNCAGSVKTAFVVTDVALAVGVGIVLVLLFATKDNWGRWH